jgi:hypothetical protein
MATVTFKNATRIYPKTNRPAVDNLSLTIYLRVKDDAVLLFDVESGARIHA